MEIKRVRPSHRDSYERLCHDAGVPRFLLDLGRDRGSPAPPARAAAGAVHRRDLPARDRADEPLLRASLPQQFDAFVWFDETTAVTPLAPEHARPGVPDTYPFGL